MDFSGGNLNKARNAVEKGLEKLRFRQGGLKGRALYAVGGIWRALAHVDMEQQSYPLRVLHHYVIPPRARSKLCRVVARSRSQETSRRCTLVPKRRAEALPYGALVHGADDPGPRVEGGRGFGLWPAGRAFSSEATTRGSRKDPLIELARDLNARESRTPGHAAELFRWMAPLFPKEEAERATHPRSDCFFSDIGWRRHPDDRAMGTYTQVLRGNYGGADHITSAR